mmetsp:Transcript_68864/g.149874  ORF Transcript_68864/g.149874 Transcript_68864/m.149874 type:complete len:295 (+) Transcript_68864:464-1348(+)
MQVFSDVLQILRELQICQLLPEPGVVNEGVILLLDSISQSSLQHELTSILDGLGVAADPFHLPDCIFHLCTEMELVPGRLLYSPEEDAQDTLERHRHLYEEALSDPSAPLALDHRREIDDKPRVEEVPEVEATTIVHESIEAIGPGLVQVERCPAEILDLFHVRVEGAPHRVWLGCYHRGAIGAPANYAKRAAEVYLLPPHQLALNSGSPNQRVSQVLRCNRIDVVLECDRREKVLLKLRRVPLFGFPKNPQGLLFHLIHVISAVGLDMPASAAHWAQRRSLRDLLCAQKRGFR